MENSDGVFFQTRYIMATELQWTGEDTPIFTTDIYKRTNNTILEEGKIFFRCNLWHFYFTGIWSTVWLAFPYFFSSAFSIPKAPKGIQENKLSIPTDDPQGLYFDK